MEIKIVTLRYQESLGGFSDADLQRALAGLDPVDVREHFFVQSGVPHLAVLCLATAPARSVAEPKAPAASRPDPGRDLPEESQGLYRALRQWRNERARKDGVPSYLIFRNLQLAEICRELPRSMNALLAIQGVGEATCAKYGEDVLGLVAGYLENQPAPAIKQATEGGEAAPAVEPGESRDA
jgi:ATP-dependent DNA helicase RecQ